MRIEESAKKGATEEVGPYKTAGEEEEGQEERSGLNGVERMAAT